MNIVLNTRQFPNTIMNPPESLRHLGQPGTPAYQKLSGKGEVPARISFEGMLEGKATTWLATLWTTASYPGNNPCGERHVQFMEVGNSREGLTPITLVLNLEKIDDGALLKALIMVRKYKRLRPGLICFGSQR